MKIIGVLLLMTTLQASAALTLVNRETFASGNLTSTNKGAFNTVTGNFYRGAVGARTSDIPAPGWSGIIRSAGTEQRSTMLMTVAPGNAAKTGGMIGAWIRFTSLPPAGYTFSFMRLSNLSGTLRNTVVDMTMNSSGVITSTPFNQKTTIVSPALPIGKWIWVAVAWKITTGTTYSIKVMTMPLGEPLNVFATVTGSAVQTSFYSVDVGGQIANSGGLKNIRISMPSLYSLDTLDDVAYPSDILPPVEESHDFYVNAATGNDANVGLTPTTAWQNISKLNAELAGDGLIGSFAGMGAGDVLHIDGTTTPFDLGTSGLILKTAGMKLVTTGPDDLKTWATIGGTWALTSGASKTYETTDNASTDLTGVVIWEDDKWMHHATGSSLSAALASLEANPGSFYSDGAKVYVHPFDDTNPSADGKVYTRSRYRAYNAGTGTSAIIVAAPNIYILGPPGRTTIRKTCLALSTNSDPYNGYAIQYDSGGGGENRLENMACDYFSKHGFGRTTSTSNMTVTRVNCHYGQGTPYVALGGQTQDVDYCDVGTGNQWGYIGCSSSVNVGVIGSTAGALSTSQGSWLSHGNSSAFASGYFQDCDLCSSINEQSDTSGTISIVGTTIGGGTVACNLSADQSTFTQSAPSNSNATKTVSLSNCVFRNFNGIGANSWDGGIMKGTLTLTNLTIDLTGNPSTAAKAIWGRAGVCNITVKNVAMLVSSGKAHCLFYGLTSADTISMDHNAYATGSTTTVLSYNDGKTTANRTLAQWQALGHDSGSFTSADLLLDTDYTPLPGSPLIGAGDDMGQLPDFYNYIVFHRNDIGAVQSPGLSPQSYSQWQTAKFGADASNDAIAGPQSTPQGDGVTNLLKYLYDIDPTRPMTAPDRAAVATVSALSVNGADYLTLTYRKNQTAVGITVNLQVSTDLKNWQTVTPDISQQAGTDALTGDSLVQAGVNVAGINRQFIRLNVTTP